MAWLLNTNMAAKSRQKPVNKHANDAHMWVVLAWWNHNGAMELFNSIDPFLSIPAAYLAHHALELMLKAALIEVGYTVAKGELEDGYAWGHTLVSLARALAPKVGNAFPIKEAESELQVFDAYFEEVRYPAELKKVTQLNQQTKNLLTKWMDNPKPFARVRGT